MFMNFVKLFCFTLLLFLHFKSSGQIFEIDSIRKDSFYNSLLDRKELSIVYAHKGLILSDWLIDDHGNKILSVFRLNNQAYSKHTPILFLNQQNLQIDSISIKNWPQDGYPATFPVLSEDKSQILYQPQIIYPDNLRFPSLRKMQNGFIKITQHEANQYSFYLMDPSKRFNSDLISYDEKREEFVINMDFVKTKIFSKSSLIRFKNDHLLLVDKLNLKFYFNSFNDSKNIYTGKIPLTNDFNIVNIEIIDKDSFLMVYRNTYTKRYYISSVDFNDLIINNLYNSAFFIPRAKSIGTDVFFEISGKFEDAIFPESIILKLESVLN